jgi:hypothetical protein
MIGQGRRRGESSDELEEPVSESSTDNKDLDRDRFLLLGGMGDSDDGKRSRDKLEVRVSKIIVYLVT